ncbi:uncharacterized protein LOC111045718 [Nilaparvata lugens]|uniref:uncharacterized protein LOC111045718 n=1 Tax=Nilaparvata lugens TaxID=108931 RepID=UPI00193EA5B8|nr:uncharacterized protein LOC111045718 [Nilaparvata lugens]
MEASSVESNTKGMESVAAVVVGGGESEVVVSQWGGGGGAVYWQQAAEEHGSNSVPEAVPVSTNEMHTAGEGTFLCLDCDMPLNIEMKKDHLLVCKSRHQDSDKVDRHQIVTSTPISRPTLLTCVSNNNQSPIVRLTTTKEHHNRPALQSVVVEGHTPLARSTLVHSVVGDDNSNNSPLPRSVLEHSVVNCNNSPLARSALVHSVIDGENSQIARSTIVIQEDCANNTTMDRFQTIANNCDNTTLGRSAVLQTVNIEENCDNTTITRGGLLRVTDQSNRSTLGRLQTVNIEGNCDNARGGILTVTDQNNRSTILVSEGNTVSRVNLITTSEGDTVVERSGGGMMGHTVISRADIMGERTVISRSDLMEEQASYGAGMLSRGNILTSVSDDTQMSRPTLITTTVNNQQPTLIATMTEDGIVVTAAPESHQLQLMESVITDQTGLGEGYVTSTTTTQPRVKSLPTIQLICQPNGKQCKVYTDEVENYKCPVCKYTTTTSSNLSTHKCITQADRLRCNECSYVAESSGSLSRHMVSHRKSRSSSSSRPLKCPPDLEKLVEKRQLDNMEEVFGCTQCDFTSSMYLSIRHHVNTHNIEKPLHCDQCSFSCKLEVNLRNHKLTHETKEEKKKKRVWTKKVKVGGVSIVCKICRYAYVEGEDPNDHIDTHLKMDPDQLTFCCQVCGVAFATVKSSRDHVRAHMKNWPYPCPECDFKCYKVLNMKVHEKTAHRKNILHCEDEECNFTCKLKSNMKLHMKSEHPRRGQKRPIEPLQIITRQKKKMAALILNCTKCEYKADTRPELEEHLKTHKSTTVYKCTECEYTCKLLRNFEHHKMIHESDSSDRE